MDVDIKVTGAKEIAEVLKQLPIAIADKVTVTGLRAGANIVRKEIQSRAPIYRGPQITFKGKRYRVLIPGLLKNSIKVRTIAKKKGGAQVAVYVAWRAFYALFLEYGTSTIQAMPFMRPAWEQVKEQVMTAILASMSRGIVREALKLAGKYRKKRK